MNGSFFGVDDQVVLKGGVKTYPIAPMSPGLNSPAFFPVCTSTQSMVRDRLSIRRVDDDVIMCTCTFHRQCSKSISDYPSLAFVVIFDSGKNTHGRRTDQCQYPISCRDCSRWPVAPKHRVTTSLPHETTPIITWDADARILNDAVSLAGSYVPWG